jgi:uncharacterized OB-fold protein
MERKGDPSYWLELHERSLQRKKEEQEKKEREQARLEKKYIDQHQRGYLRQYESQVWKLQCHNCGRIFYTERADYSRIKFCKQECQQAMANKMAKEARRERNLKQCKQCGQVFQAKKADTVYCSHACKQKAYRGRRTDTQIGTRNECYGM